MWPFSRAASSGTETRDATVPVSVPYGDFIQFFGLNDTANLPHVTIDSALTVPAVWCAVAFLSRTLATLPLHAYRNTKDGPQKITGKLESVVHDAPNDGMDSFKFRQYFWQQVFTGGRGLAWIERTPQGIEALWPMDPMSTTIKRSGFKTIYTFTDKWTGKSIEYPAEDVIDVPFMLKSDGLCHYGPINMAAKAIQLALAMNDYGSNFFAGGGVPPLALKGPLPAGADAMNRALADVTRAIDNAKKTGKPITPIPGGYELVPVGFDPAKGQMVEARLFQVQEIARAYQLPRVFLQDLTGATNSNTEQQNLMLVQHLIGQWAQALEGEMNLKMFGRGNAGRYIEHNLDGILRGDFVARMAGLAQGVQNALITPNEGRALDNRPALKGGDDLLIQGATVPLGSQLVAVATKPATATTNDNNKTDGANAA